MKIPAKLVIAGGVLLVGILVVVGLRIVLKQEGQKSSAQRVNTAESAGAPANGPIESRSPAPPERVTTPRKPSSLNINLQRPDALIVTRSLAQFPKDVASIPLLKDLLTEDFFYYYEQNEGGLSLRGTLRRIAYEHKLNIGDEVIDYIFSAPAKLAFWKGRDGKLGHFMLVMDRGPLVQTLELVSKAVLSDNQLSRKGEVQLTAGGALAVHELKFAHDRSLFFAGIGSYLAVFSDAEMLLSGNGAKKDSIRAFVEASDPSEAFLRRFESGRITAKHSVAVATSYLSFGYQRFFPAFEAIRFEYGENGWTASVLLNQKVSEAPTLWTAAPTGAAICAALPVAPGTLTGILSKMAPADRLKTVIDSIESPAAICWYRQSRLFTPLVLVKVKEGPSMDALLKEMFEKSIGAHEAGIPGPEEEKEDREAGQNGEKPQSEKHDEQTAKQDQPAEEKPQDEPAEAKKSYLPPFEVHETQLPQGVIWRREVSSLGGKYEQAQSPDAERMWSKRFFKVTLARWKDILIFSPDDALVDNAVAALEKKYPAVSDSIPPKSSLSLIVFPADLGELVRSEVLQSLPEEQETVFRSNVTRVLMPVLGNLKSYPAYGLWTPQGSKGWEPLRWQPLASH
ncbi:MAG TPA: DUF2138 family protein [Syntrophobacteraceae bacterium]|nr:DUF2138 family protein [Syntrophobacteraceae bacterium]